MKGKTYDELFKETGLTKDEWLFVLNMETAQILQMGVGLDALKKYNDLTIKSELYKANNGK